jgi:D-alanyl-D-alanine carboxypeptidase
MLRSRTYWLLFLILIFLPATANAVHKHKNNFIMKAELLADMDSSKILYEQNADKLIQPASLSKILAFYLINEDLHSGKIHLNDMVEVSANAVRTKGQKMLRKTGEKVRLEDLVKGMAVLSANDATVAMAEYVEGSVPKFVERMNAKAKELGMTQSYFVNPHGLPSQHQLSTAHDIFILSKAYLQHFPDALRLHSIQNFTYKFITHHNSNRLLRDCPDVDGLKTGYVRRAGYHLVATAKRGDTRLIAIVLGAKNSRVRAIEAKKLLENGFGQISDKHLPQSIDVSLKQSNQKL